MGLSFHLADEFVNGYRDKKVNWGYQDAAGNALGEITYIRTYSRFMQESGKEKWVDTCARVINGMYSIQKDHAKSQRLPWSDSKASASAKEAFDRMFTFKWTPPGRGLWMMGTPLVNEQKNSAALQNCAFVSTSDMNKNNPAKPFAFLMEASMLGIGVGFDNKGADKDFSIYEPQEGDTYVIPDSREGWVESTASLINSYLKSDTKRPVFDYSQIRPAGEPIKTFGGTAAGADPLIKLHDHIRKLFSGRAEQKLTRTDIADLGNIIGVCVVSGNVRRSAELLMGSIDDQEFLDLKNYEVNPERNNYDPTGVASGWGWMSNNSVEVTVGTDFTPIVEAIALNGEPGVIWMDVTRKYGRLADAPNNKDWRAQGYNPCAEQSLESYECCTLVETYIGNHESKEDFLRTLKFAYLYAKTVTLLPTHWEETNAIMQRNRRIGTSISGIADFVDSHGIAALGEWMNEGYAVVKNHDKSYSEWLGIRESIKTTTVKPSGTVSILANASPGVHWTPGGEYFLRAMRLDKNSPIVPLLQISNYTVEPASEDPKNTVVAYFPIHSRSKRSEKQVSIFEKANLAAVSQHYWSDNSVSVTVSFDAEKEKSLIGDVLRTFDGSFKTVSFLPMGNKVYPQMPYSEITKEEFEEYRMKLMPIDFAEVYAGMTADALGEKYCTNDVCVV